ncbi:MAG: hypothetical protein WBV85_07405 [Solirubrobacteraceae bacterium]
MTSHTHRSLALREHTRPAMAIPSPFLRCCPHRDEVGVLLPLAGLRVAGP